MKPNDEVTLVATITVRYPATRGLYSEHKDPLLTDAQMAAVDQAQIDDGGVAMVDVVGWANSPQDITVRITPDA